jgi:hypothetical protein
MLTNNRTEIRYSLIALALWASLVALARTQAFSGVDAVIDDFFDLMSGLGFVGFFVVAVIAKLLIRMPYTVPLLSLALGGASLDQMLLMGLASGLGAACGEIFSYGITLRIFSESLALEKNFLFRWVNRTANAHPRMAPLLVFIWSTSPLPDDPVIFPLAMAGYGIKRMLLPIFGGKITQNIAVATMFYYFTSWSADRVSTNVQADLALGILILFVMMILYQVEKNRANGKAPVTTLTTQAG